MMVENSAVKLQHSLLPKCYFKENMQGIQQLRFHWRSRVLLSCWQPKVSRQKPLLGSICAQTRTWNLNLDLRFTLSNIDCTIDLLVFHSSSKACLSCWNGEIVRHKLLLGPICAQTRTQNVTSSTRSLWVKSSAPLKFSCFTHGQEHGDHVETLKCQTKNHWGPICAQTRPQNLTPIQSSLWETSSAPFKLSCFTDG